jgi:ribosomal protein S18 acetylase RimI-like enzyme
MSGPSDSDLYLAGVQTLLASWEVYARGSPGARVGRAPGVVAAVFPTQPERGLLNNALLERDRPPGRRAEAIAAMERAYASAGVIRFAAWVHENDRAHRNELEARGYRIDTSTRAMGMALGDVRLPRSDVDLARAEWSAYVRFLERAGAPTGLLGGVDPTAFHLRIARCDGADVAAALAFDRHGDTGIYNVTTLEPARRCGFGTALTALLLHDAAARGCRTASLQSTEMAEGIYAALGFRDLGRLLEYVPAA